MTLPNIKTLRIQTLRLASLAFVLIACAGAQAPQTVQLTVDYNDGVQEQFVLPLKTGMTVYDAMILAQANPHGLKFGCDPKYPCDGPPANRLLSYIDDVRNQGGGSSAKNWLLRVNNVFSDQGFGVCKIGAADKVLWKFDTFQNQKPGKACR
jgi:hypothetical protein